MLNQWGLREVSARCGVYEAHSGPQRWSSITDHNKALKNRKEKKKMYQHGVLREMFLHRCLSPA